MLSPTAYTGHSLTILNKFSYPSVLNEERKQKKRERKRKKLASRPNVVEAGVLIH